jgi:hypothetical protein
MSETLNIHQRINAVMSECEYMQKKEAQQGKGLKYDDLVAMLRPLIVKHGIVPIPTQTSLVCINDVQGTKQKIYQGEYKIELCNMDAPEDKVTYTFISHGMDGGDKAPGKAHTYAAKAMLKVGFLVETGEDEESRAEKLESQTITDEQFNQLAPFCLYADEKQVLQWSNLGLEIAKKYGLDVLASLPKNKFKEVLQVCKARASTAT